MSINLTTDQSKRIMDGVRFLTHISNTAGNKDEYDRGFVNGIEYLKTWLVAHMDLLVEEPVRLTTKAGWEINIEYKKTNENE